MIESFLSLAHALVVFQKSSIMVTRDDKKVQEEVELYSLPRIFYMKLKSNLAGAGASHSDPVSLVIFVAK